MKNKYPPIAEPGPVRPTVMHANFYMMKPPGGVAEKLFRKMNAEDLVKSRGGEEYTVMPNGEIRRHDRQLFKGKRARISKKLRLRMRWGRKNFYAE